MNFKEAMAVISEDVWVTNSEIDNEFVYRFKDGVIEGVNMGGDPSAWREQSFEKYEMRATWKIYRGPKPKKSQGLWQTNGELCNMYYHFPSMPSFVDANEKSQWLEAMNTFLRLKSHPLARKWNRGNRNTWYICYSYNEDTEAVPLRDFKRCMSGLSPEFDSQHDARTCMQEIGKKELRKMFEVFQGTYERQNKT